MGLAVASHLHFTLIPIECWTLFSIMKSNYFDAVSQDNYNYLNMIHQLINICN